MKYFSLILFLVFLFNGCQLTNKNAKDDENISSSESCLAHNNIKVEENIANHIYVIVDQTVIYDDNIQSNVLSKIKPLIDFGTEITIIKFSTFSEGHYTSIVADYKIENRLIEDVRNDISRHKLKKFDKCMDHKLVEIKKVIPGILYDTLNESNESIAHSELFKTFQEISLLTKFKKDKGQRTLIIVSDMLENSSASSFYKNNKIKVINTNDEIKKVIVSGYKADFLNAHVYVIGAGLLATKYRNKVSSNDKIMNSIRLFWNQYFKDSHAVVYGFGMPELLDKIE